jgi:hypothetical protein
MGKAVDFGERRCGTVTRLRLSSGGMTTDDGVRYDEGKNKVTLVEIVGLCTVCSSR